MSPVGFDALALVTVANEEAMGASEKGQLFGFFLEDQTDSGVVLSDLKLVDVCLVEVELSKQIFSVGDGCGLFLDHCVLRLLAWLVW